MPSFFSVAPQRLVDHGKRVATANVLDEIDVPLEDPGHFHRQGIGNAGPERRLEQRCVDLPVSVDRASLEIAFGRDGFEPAFSAPDLKQFDRVDFTDQLQDRAVTVRDLNLVAGFQHTQILGGVGKHGHLGEIGELQAVAPEQDLQGIAAVDEQIDGRGVCKPGRGGLLELRADEGRRGGLRLRCGQLDGYIGNCRSRSRILRSGQFRLVGFADEQ